MTLKFARAWDLHAVKPPFFPVPSCVAFGLLASPAVALSSTVQQWSGRLPHANAHRDQALQVLARADAVVQEAGDVEADEASPYHSRFIQGASVVPRMMFVVDQRAASPLGAGAGRVAIVSRRTPNEKTPWKNLAALEGTVERQFVRPMLLGETILPYRVLTPVRAVVPWDNQRLLHTKDERLSSYPGLEEWLTKAEALWKRHGSSQLSLREQLDYRRKLSGQFPLPPHRLVYTKSGMYLAAARAPADCIIDHNLYWGTTSTVDEARFLEAILNSDTLTIRVRPLQARGEHNPRDYDKYVWQLPIPIYDPHNERHARLVHLACEAEVLVAGLTLPAKRFELQRRVVREALAASPIGPEIERLVTEIVAG
jgi:hypothetical protein